MNIIVEGKSEIEVEADLMIINLEFKCSDKTYDRALEKGTNSVKEVLDKIIPKLKLEESDFITKDFNISRKTKNNIFNGKEKELGFDFVQSAEIQLPYNRENLKNFMNEIVKLKTPPIYYLDFKVKNKEKLEKEIMKKALIEAESKAKLIAETANKKLINCEKIEYKNKTGNWFEFSKSGSRITFDDEYDDSEEDNDLEESTFLRKRKILSLDKEVSYEKFSNTFTPEKIKLSEEIMCLWKAE